MKGVAMNASERRTVLIALAVLVPSLGWVFGVKPLRASLAATNDRIATERDALARERTAILEASRSPVRKRFADSAMAATDARLFTGANEVAAGATLVSYLGEVARRTHVWLASAATRAATGSGGRGLTPGSAAGSAAGSAPRLGLPPGVAAQGGRGGAAAAPALPDGLRALRVEVRAESDFQGVLEFLDALERGPKVVTVERLDIARTLRAGDEDRETLSVNATVVGYSIVPAATPGAANAASAPRAEPGRGAK